MESSRVSIFVRSARVHPRTGRLRSVSALLITMVITLAGVALASPAQALISGPSAPFSGTWRVTSTWHGTGSVMGLPDGTALDYIPVNGASPNIYSVASGKVVRRCSDAGHGWIVIDHGSGIGRIGYVHLTTSALKAVGSPVAAGELLGQIYPARSTGSVVSWGACGSGNGPHFHVAFERRDALQFAGQFLPTGVGQQVTIGKTSIPRTFSGDATSSAIITADRQEIRLTVCANNITGQTVHARLGRLATATLPAKVWTYQKVATSRCVTFTDMEGAGGVLSGHTYVTRAALNQPPLSTWPTSGCYAATSGQGLCDTLRS